MTSALRSQIFDFLRETFRKRALRVPAIGSFRKKTNKNAVFLRKRATITDLFEGVVGGDSFSPLAPVLL